jgi:hypothetical protein
LWQSSHLTIGDATGYADARHRIRAEMLPLSFFTSFMSQPGKQSTVFM